MHSVLKPELEEMTSDTEQPAAPGVDWEGKFRAGEAPSPQGVWVRVPLSAPLFQ